MSRQASPPAISHPPVNDVLVALLLFIGISVLYFATLSGITSSNDGSHYALLRTMVENHTFTLNQFDDYAEGNDIAITPDGRLFSDRPPGTAVTAIPFYLLGDLLPNPLQSLPSRHDAENPRLPYVLLLPVLAGAGTAIVLYWLLRRLQVGQAAAILAVVFFALGTAQWKYSTVLFSHALSGFLIISAVALVLWLADTPDVHWPWYLLLGLLSGWAVVVEYSNALVVIIVGLYWLIVSWPRITWRPWTTVVPWIAGGLIAAVFLGFYNSVNFGSPLTLSYAYALNYPWAGNFATTFNFPLWPGLKALLVWGEGGGWCGGPPCVNQGIFLLSPVLLLALPGLLPYHKRNSAWFWLTTILFIVYLLLFAKHQTSHGFTADGRYLVPFLSLLVLPLGFTLDWILSPARQAWVRAVGLLVVFGLFFLSLRNMFVHIGLSFNYTLDLGQWGIWQRPRTVGAWPCRLDFPQYRQSPAAYPSFTGPDRVRWPDFRLRRHSS
ncbi:MAG: phospholipid carrier-dependent glycosyltransferase [Chloroflexota bacterium]